MSAAPKTGHAEAYRRWFSAFERERKARKIAPGRRVPDFPPPPTGPEEVARLVDCLGEARAIALAGVHRTTLARWQSGDVQIPAAAYAVLRFHVDGVPPGCRDAWRGFSWHGDSLTCPDGRTTVTAQEIAGLHYQRAHIAALERKCAALEAQLAAMARRLGTDGAANDGYTRAGDARDFQRRNTAPKA